MILFLSFYRIITDDNRDSKIQKDFYHSNLQRCEGLCIVFEGRLTVSDLFWTMLQIRDSRFYLDEIKPCSWIWWIVLTIGKKEFREFVYREVNFQLPREGKIV